MSFFKNNSRPVREVTAPTRCEIAFNVMVRMWLYSFPLIHGFEDTFLKIWFMMHLHLSA